MRYFNITRIINFQVIIQKKLFFLPGIIQKKLLLEYGSYLDTMFYKFFNFVNVFATQSHFSG